MTQMVGALDAPKQSGALGEGASGNPDDAPGGNASLFTDPSYRWQPPGLAAPGVLPAYLDNTGHVTTRPPSELQQPGYERTSLIVTTNLPFEAWTEVLGSERLTGALLDRLTHRVRILEANGESYRLAESKQRLKRSLPREA